MTKQLFWLSACLSVVLAASAAQATVNAVVLSTGLDASNSPVTVSGGSDAHWTVNGNPAQVVTSSSPDWYSGWPSDGPNSAWIARNANTFQNGVNVYFRTFDLSGYDISTVSMAGSWWIDDQGPLALNGHQIDYSPWDGWSATRHFSVPVGSPFFNAGANTLSISIDTSDNFFDGVRLEGTLTASPIPEPCTLALLVAAGLGLTGWVWRRASRRTVTKHSNL
jgi:hypothetical protein